MSQPHDDFDYPSPQRETNWTLPKPIAHRERGAVGGTGDISGAQASTTAVYLHVHRFRRNVDLHDPQYIDGAVPRALVKKNKRSGSAVDLSLSTSDIAHSSPEVYRGPIKRSTDPLEPKYTLPSVSPTVYDVPRFTRDTLDVSDINAGMKPTRRERLKDIFDREQKDDFGDRKDRERSVSSHVKDDQGAGVGKASPPRKPREVPPALIDVGRKRRGPKVWRCTNPLNPTYNVCGPRGLEQIGEIPGTRPSPSPIPRSVMFSLDNSDIEGAHTGTYAYTATRQQPLVRRSGLAEK